MGILDDNYDPVGNLGSIPGMPGGGTRRGNRPEYRKPLSPEEFKGVGQRALDTGASGLQYVLGTLDKPGQAVRGVLAGHGASALKHLVPFSDSLGLTNEHDQVSGRDLTDKYGITDKRDKGWGAWGAGLAASVATDPLIYTNFGAKHALTGIGEAVKKTGALKGMSGRALIEGFHGSEPAMLAAGKSASDISHAIDQGRRIATGPAAATGVQAGQPLSGLVRVGLPFGPKAVFGTGQTAQNIAGALDTAGDYLKFGNPVGRAVGSLFDSTRHGAVDKITQKGAQTYLDPALRSLKRTARDDSFGVVKELDPLVSQAAFPESAITDAARGAAEGVTHHFDPALNAQVGQVGGQIRDIGARQIGEARKAGAPIKDVGDKYAGYVHRSALPENPASLQVGGTGRTGLLPVTSGANISRDELYRDIPGATHRINDWFGRFAGNPDKAAVARAVKKDMVQDLVAQGLPLNRALGKTFDEKAVALAERLAVSSPERLATATHRGGLFSPDLAADVAQRGSQHARTVANTNAAIGILGDNARRIVPGDGLIPVTKAMRDLGLKTYKADKAAGTPMEGALVQAYRALAKQGAGKVDPFLMGKMKTLHQQVGQYGITPEHYDQLTKAYSRWAAPEQIKSSLGALDSITNAFKALSYPIWIPAHVRNAMTAGLNNATRGVGIGDYLDQLKVMTGRGSRDLSGIHPSLAGLPPAEQIDALRRLQNGAANIFGGHGMNEEIAGNVTNAIRDGKRFTPNVPGSDRVGPYGNVVGDTANLVINDGLLGSLSSGARALRDSTRGLFDPARSWGQSIGEHLGIRGVGGAAADALPAVNAGRKAGTNVEDFFRGAQFNSELRGGAAPGVAADEVNRLHFDYDALAPFEKNVMRRLVPFYTFARKNLPLQADIAAHTPGMLTAQYAPFNQPEPGGKGYVPQYLNSGAAVPLGPEFANAEGRQSRQYLSKLGLPGEEAFERLHFRNGMPDIGATALDFAGQLNPILKGPLEQLFDTQFHTQRRLSDLKAPQTASAIGQLWNDDNPQLLSQAFANSPLTRFVSSADKITDPRKSWWQKALNLGTGVRVTDVDLDKQRAIDTRGALESIMRSHPNLSRYSSFYVKPENAQELTPEEVEMMRAYSVIQANAKAYAEEKRQRIGLR